MDKTIKTCPFCGGEVTVAISGDDEEQFYFITRGNGENKCTCRVFMESEKFYTDEDNNKKKKIRQKLIENWNKRTCSCKK